MQKYLDTKNKIFRNISTPELLNISLENKFKLDTKKQEAYIIYKGLEYLKIQLPYLPITDYTIQKNIHNLDNYIYVILKSKNANTHPFIIYCNKKSNQIYCVMSYGKELNMGQYQLADFEYLINYNLKYLLSRSEYYALFLLFADSIQTRKIDLITHNKFSLLNCSNIKQCVAVTNKIKRDAGMIITRTKTIKNTTPIPNNIKFEILTKELYYKKKAIAILERFFKILDNGNFEEAYKFLKVEKKKCNICHKYICRHSRVSNKNEYFGKERLDTFFKSNYKLIGHLEIFISLYKLIHNIVHIL